MLKFDRLFIKSVRGISLYAYSLCSISYICCKIICAAISVFLIIKFMLALIPALSFPSIGFKLVSIPGHLSGIFYLAILVVIFLYCT